MELRPEDFMNSPMLWVACSFMIIGVLVQSATFIMTALKSADKMGIPRSECVAGMRAAMITSVGPAFAPVLVLMALITVVGAPFAWMSMNNIGAARTEIAMAQIAATQAESTLKAGELSMLGFVFILWGIALNHCGWIIFGGYGAPYLKGGVDYMKKTFDQNWVKLLMTAAALGLFGALLSNSVIARGALNPRNFFAAAAAFVAMTVISHIFKGNQRIQEFSLGLAMLVGMYTTVALVGAGVFK